MVIESYFSRVVFYYKFSRKEDKNMTYEKAVAELVVFDNNDVITTSSGCETWSNQNGVSCHYGLTD